MSFYQPALLACDMRVLLVHFGFMIDVFFLYH